MTLYQVHERTLRQTRVPLAAVTRVDGGMRSLAQTATLAGAAAGGALGALFDARGVLSCAAAALVAAAVLAASGLARR